MKKKYKTNCCSSAIFCLWVYAINTKQEVRLAVFNIRKGVDHVQAQVKNGDKWEYLTEIHDVDGMAAIVYKKNHPDAKEPYRYVGLMEFIAEQKELLNLKI